jgi:hypothetical protein
LLAKNHELTERLEKLEKPRGENGEIKPAPPAEKAPAATPKPELSKFERYEDYVEAVADWKASEKVRLALEEVQKAEKDRQAAQAKTEREKQENEIRDAWMRRVEEAKKKHPDIEEKIFSKETLPVEPGTVMFGFILDSEIGPELAYYLAEHQDEFKRIAALGPNQQARELTKIELTLLSPAPPKKETKAPPPPRELGSGHTPPEDEVEAAARGGDVGAYIRLANQRDLARAKRG